MRVRAACRRGGGRHGRAIRTVRQHERGLPARTIRITSADLKKTTTTKNLPLFYFTLPNTSLYSCLSLRLPEHEGDDGSVLSRDTRHPESLISVSFFFSPARSHAQRRAGGQLGRNFRCVLPPPQSEISDGRERRSNSRPVTVVVSAARWCRRCYLF